MNLFAALCLWQPTIIINEVPPKHCPRLLNIQRLTTIAGNTAIKRRNKDPERLSMTSLYQDNLKFQPPMAWNKKPPLLNHQTFY
jgi:hypothetical protein